MYFNLFLLSFSERRRGGVPDRPVRLHNQQSHLNLETTLHEGMPAVQWDATLWLDAAAVQSPAASAGTASSVMIVYSGHFNKSEDWKCGIFYYMEVCNYVTQRNESLWSAVVKVSIRRLPLAIQHNPWTSWLILTGKNKSSDFFWPIRTMEWILFYYLGKSSTFWRTRFAY